MPDELETITCDDAAAWGAWLAANHGRQEGVWLKIAKRHSGVASVTNDEAWFLQRFTPRRPRSSWSAVNVAKVEMLTAAGRMRAPGQAEVDAADRP